MTQSCDAHKPANGYILVAEDDHIVQLVLKKILEQAGYKADFVADGKAVLSALASQDYDLVVMDCLMPRLDGFEATRLIRNAGSSRFNPNIPVIALTGLATMDDQDRCRDAGMDHFVSKPVDSHALIAAIEQCLGSAAVAGSAPQQNEIQRKQIWEDGFLDAVIDNFLTEVPQVIAGLQRAVKRQDIVKLQNIGHKLRGATDILKASKLSTLSNALEQAGESEDITLAGRLASELIEELHKLNFTLTE